MSAEVMKEFLVSLGWKIDKQGEKDVLNAVAGVTKAAGAMALALGAAALAATAAVARIAAGFDTLYFSSQRTGASVQNIKALQYAFSQVGSSSEAAASAIEAYAKAIRTNPGVGQYVKDLGVKQTGDAFNDLSAAIDKIQAKNPYYAGAQMAGLLGISEEQYETFTRYRKEIATYRAEYEKFTKRFGLNNEEAAKSSASFMRGLNSLGTMATVVGQKFLVALAPAFDRVVKGILAWIDANPEKIERIFNAIATAAEWVAKTFKAVWDVGVQLFDFLSAKAEEMTSDGSFLRMWEKVVTVFDRVANAIKSVLTWVRELDRATDMSGGLRAIGRVLGWIEGKTSGFVEGGAAAAGAIDRATQTSVGVPEGNAERGGIFARARRGLARRLGIGDGPSGSVVSDGGGSRASIAGRTFNGKAPGVMKRLMEDFGLSKQEAAVVLGNLGHESAGFTAFEEGGNGPGRGWAQWTDPGRKRRFFEYAKNNNLDPKSDEANYGFLRWELRNTHKSSIANLKRAEGADEKMRVFERDFEGAGVKHYASRFRYMRDAERAYDAAQAKGDQASQPAPLTAPPPMPKGFNPGSFDVNRLGAPPMGSGASSNDNSRSVTQNNPINVTINGASDPATTATAAERAVGRANDLSLRNAQSAIR